MNANVKTEALPQFEVRVLDTAEISMVSGGYFMNEEFADCTCGTTSVCHVDGTTDGD